MGPWPLCLAWVRPMGLANRYFYKCTDFRATVTCTIPTSSPTKAHRPHFWRCRELGCCQDERAERGCRAEWDRDLLQTPMDTHPHLLGLTQKPGSPPVVIHCLMFFPSPPLPPFSSPRFLPQSCSLLSISIKHKPGPLPLLLRTCYGSPVPPGESWGFSHSLGGPVCSAPPPDPLSYHQVWPVS